MKQRDLRGLLLSATMFVLMLVLSTAVLAETSDVLTRDQIDEQDKWDLSDIYPDWEAWQADMEKIEGMMDKFAGLKGSLSSGPEAILKAYLLNDEIDIVAYKVYRYPGLQNKLDSRDNDISAKLQQVQILFSQFETKTAWLAPEMLSIGWDKVGKWLEETEALAPFRYPIVDLYRQQEHVLSEDKEQLLSYFGQFNSSVFSAYTAISSADIKFGEIVLADGKTVTVTPATYRLILATNREQDDRARAFESHYGIYNSSKNTYAALYNQVLQRDWAKAQARGFSSCMEATLDGNNVPVDVYKNLVKAVSEGVGPAHRYYALRKKHLGLETYHGYDGSIPLVEFDKTYEWDEAVAMVIEAVSPLGKDYQDKIRFALENRWVDVYETAGKTSGAFHAGTYGVHPYVLMNYNKTLDNIFTLAHEMGHAMHSVLSEANQPKATSAYTIFVAEVASTLNERLLMEYMLRKTDDPIERVALLQQQIEGILRTFYTQVMFADYEMQAHEMVENGTPITAESLTELYSSLWKNNMGEAVTFDSLYGTTWARISHFYRSPYYVYKYATCYASSAQIVGTILAKGENADPEAALERYMNLLKAGGSDYPMELLKEAGVDLSQPEPVQAMVDLLGNLVTRYEQELEKL